MKLADIWDAVARLPKWQHWSTYCMRALALLTVVGAASAGLTQTDTWGRIDPRWVMAGAGVGMVAAIPIWVGAMVTDVLLYLARLQTHAYLADHPDELEALRQEARLRGSIAQI